MLQSALITWAVLNEHLPRSSRKLGFALQKLIDDQADRDENGTDKEAQYKQWNTSEQL